jgi:hypothetical protein
LAPRTTTAARLVPSLLPKAKVEAEEQGEGLGTSQAEPALPGSAACLAGQHGAAGRPAGAQKDELTKAAGPALSTPPAGPVSYTDENLPICSTAQQTDSQAGLEEEASLVTKPVLPLATGGRGAADGLLVGCPCPAIITGPDRGRDACGIAPEGASASPAAHIRRLEPEKFSGKQEEYWQWKEDVQSMLDGVYSERCQNLYLMQIRKNLPEAHREVVEGVGTVQEAWDQLDRHFGDTTLAAATITYRLRGLQLTNTAPHERVISLACAVRRADTSLRLHRAGHLLASNLSLISCLVDKLAETHKQQWDVRVATHLRAGGSVSWDTFRAWLAELHDAARRPQASTSRPSAVSALATSGADPSPHTRLLHRPGVQEAKRAASPALATPPVNLSIYTSASVPPVITTSTRAGVPGRQAHPGHLPGHSSSSALRPPAKKSEPEPRVRLEEEASLVTEPVRPPGTAGWGAAGLPASCPGPASTEGLAATEETGQQAEARTFTPAMQRVEPETREILVHTAMDDGTPRPGCVPEPDPCSPPPEDWPVLDYNMDLLLRRGIGHYSGGRWASALIQPPGPARDRYQTRLRLRRGCPPNCLACSFSCNLGSWRDELMHRACDSSRSCTTAELETALQAGLKADIDYEAIMDQEYMAELEEKGVPQANSTRRGCEGTEGRAAMEEETKQQVEPPASVPKEKGGALPDPGTRSLGPRPGPAIEVSRHLLACLAAPKAPASSRALPAAWGSSRPPGAQVAYSAQDTWLFHHRVKPTDLRPVGGAEPEPRARLEEEAGLVTEPVLPLAGCPRPAITTSTKGLAALEEQQAEQRAEVLAAAPEEEVEAVPPLRPLHPPDPTRARRLHPPGPTRARRHPPPDPGPPEAATAGQHGVRSLAEGRHLPSQAGLALATPPAGPASYTNTSAPPDNSPPCSTEQQSGVQPSSAALAPVGTAPKDKPVPGYERASLPWGGPHPTVQLVLMEDSEPSAKVEAPNSSEVSYPPPSSTPPGGAGH